MKLPADFSYSGHSLRDLKTEVLWMRGQEADPGNPLDSANFFEQLGETFAGLGVMVAVDILAEKLDFFIPAVSQVGDFGQDGAKRPVFFATPGEGDDAVSAEIVTPFHDRDVGARRTLPEDEVGRCLLPFL